MFWERRSWRWMDWKIYQTVSKILPADKQQQTSVELGRRHTETGWKPPTPPSNLVMFWLPLYLFHAPPPGNWLFETCTWTMLNFSSRRHDWAFIEESVWVNGSWFCYLENRSGGGGGVAGLVSRSMRQKKEKVERMSWSDKDCVVRNEPAGEFNHLWRKLIYIHTVIPYLMWYKTGRK